MLVVPNLDVVPRVGLLDARVVRDPQLRLVRLVLHRRHHVAIDAEDLDAIHALCFSSRTRARAAAASVGRPNIGR